MKTKTPDVIKNVYKDFHSGYDKEKKSINNFFTQITSYYSLLKHKTRSFLHNDKTRNMSDEQKLKALSSRGISMFLGSCAMMEELFGDKAYSVMVIVLDNYQGRYKEFFRVVELVGGAIDKELLDANIDMTVEDRIELMNIRLLEVMDYEKPADTRH